MKKQILPIVYSLVSIILGLLFATTYNEFEFLIPIALASMFAVYFICSVDGRVNFKGMAIYMLLLAITFTFLFSIPPQSQLDEFRLLCMNALAVMFVILGGLAGGILRYKFYQMEKRKDMESEENERTKK